MNLGHELAAVRPPMPKSFESRWSRLPGLLQGSQGVDRREDERLAEFRCYFSRGGGDHSRKNGGVITISPSVIARLTEDLKPRELSVEA